MPVQSSATRSGCCPPSCGVHASCCFAIGWVPTWFSQQQAGSRARVCAGVLEGGSAAGALVPDVPHGLLVPAHAWAGQRRLSGAVQVVASNRRRRPRAMRCAIPRPGRWASLTQLCPLPCKLMGAVPQPQHGGGGAVAKAEALRAWPPQRPWPPETSEWPQNTTATASQPKASHVCVTGGSQPKASPRLAMCVTGQGAVLGRQ